MITAGRIIASSSILSKEQVSEYTYFGLYIHLLRCIIVAMVLFLLCLLCFNDDTVFLTVLCDYYASYDSHMYTCFLVDEAHMTAVVSFCLWQVTSSG